MGTDKNDDVLWVGNSWGSSLAKINTRTNAMTFVPLPSFGLQPYQIAVDNNHNAWLNIWTSDVVMKYEPSTGKWTTLDLPTRGTEARYISLLEKDGTIQVTIPRHEQIAVMTFRAKRTCRPWKAQ